MMLILQTPRRSVIVKDGLGALAFPADVVAVADLGPAEVFGAAPLSGRLTLRPSGQVVTLERDSFHGGIKLPEGGMLPPTSVSGLLFDVPITIIGAQAQVRHRMSAEAGLRILIDVMTQALPAAIAAAVRAPVEVLGVHGTIAGRAFVVEAIPSSQAAVHVVDLSTEIQRKLDRIKNIPEPAYARVMSAHRYVLQAHRLRYASAYSSQFVGERLLNYYKAIEVLFGRLADQLRAELGKLGVVSEVIELLVALVYIRDEVDIGHPAMTALTQSEYETVHEFLIDIEEVVPWLLDLVLDRAIAGTYEIEPMGAGRSKRDRTIERLAKLTEKVRPLRQETFARGGVVNAPSTTGNVSGGGRGNAPPGGSK